MGPFVDDEVLTKLEFNSIPVSTEKQSQKHGKFCESYK